MSAHIHKNEGVEFIIPYPSYRKTRFSDLNEPKHLNSVISISIDWILIIGAYILLYQSIFLFPLTALIIGSRMRAISNLSHDASHVNLFKNKRINDLVSNIFCALPMFETISFYRKSHMKHHQFLGDVERDPDSIAHLACGYDDSQPWKGNAVRNYLKIIFKPKALSASFFGSLFKLSAKEHIMLIFWWAGVALLLTKLFSTDLTLVMFCVWFLSKITTYHLIRIFAEFLDHTGLENKGAISFTRNLPHNGFLRFVFHPNCDTYHIVHHLYPRIPHYNLSKADKVLFYRVDYAHSHHCDSYFFGKHSAANCWVGACGGNQK